MSLDKKIGQMLAVGFHSKRFDEELRYLIEDLGIGNFILFTRNLGNKAEIAELNRSIQDSELKSTGIPAFICIDQEGGMVTRIREDATFFPGNMAFTAAAGDTFLEGLISGRELKALGINLNLAPVLDVNNNPLNPVIGVRSYSEDEKVVADFGGRYIEGMKGAGILSAAKHFPGHGDTCVDSHLDLPSVGHAMERIRKVELHPFREAIKRGIDAIMTAHLLFPAIEPEKLPATLSPAVLTGLLRGELGYRGLILTDCMEMKAIASYYGTVNAAVMAVKAGADLILVSHSPELQRECLQALKKAVLAGDIPEDRINESVGRILDLKNKYGFFENPYPNTEAVENIVGCKGHRAFAAEVSLNSITLVKDDEGLLPLSGEDRIAVISPRASALNGADDSIPSGFDFCDEVARELGGEALLIPLNPSDPVIEKTVAAASAADIVILGTYNAVFNRGQGLLIKELSRTCGKLIAVSLRSPYDYKLCQAASACLCAYEYTPLSIESIIKVLKGEKTPYGKLPMKVSRME